MKPMKLLPLLLLGVRAHLPVRHCSDSPDAFTAVVIGHTGFGKSTLIDMIAGGVEVAQTSSGGEAQTEQTQCYVMDYLANLNPKIQGKTWRVIDTPGSADTGGMDVRNQKAMTATLRGLGRVDAILLVWKFGAGERFTPEIMRSVGMMRLAFGPKVWKRLIIVYTFVQWMSIDPYRGEKTCHSFHTFRESEHKVVVKAMHDYIKGTLKAPEVLCDQASDEDCFLDYKRVPFVGTGSTVENVRHYMATGDDYFDPNSTLYAHNYCETDAHQFDRLWHFAMGLWSLPILKTNALVNMFVECETALRGIDAVKKKLLRANVTKEKLEAELHTSACSMSTCWSSYIGQYASKAQCRLLGNGPLQVRLAFALRDIDEAKWVKFTNGFEIVTAKELPLYPDASTFLKCTQNLNEDIKRNCYSSLKDYYARDHQSDPRVCAERRSTLDVLASAVVCTCDRKDNKNDNSFSCQGFKGLADSCPDDYACVSEPFPAVHHGGSRYSWQDVCKHARMCEDSVCDGRYHYFDISKTNFACLSSTQCHVHECCRPSATCDAYQCSGTNSNYGSNTLCFGPPEHCTSKRCCYCAAWNVFDLGLGCLLFEAELAVPVFPGVFGGKSVVAVASCAALSAALMLSLLLSRCTRRPSAAAMPLLSAADA